MVFSLWKLPGTWVITNLWDHFLIVLGASTSSLCWTYRTIIFLEHFHPPWLTLHLFSNCKLSLILCVNFMKSCFTQVLGGLLHTYLHLPLGVGEVIGYLWQLVELLFVMKMMVWHFVSNPHKVIDLWLYSWSCYLQTVVVQISLQSHRYDFSFWLDSQSSLEFSGLYDHVKNSIYGMDCRDMESNDLTGPFPAELIWGFQNLQLV